MRGLILEYSLPGLLIEPLPDQFEKLVRNYSGSRGRIFENVAIDEKPGVVQIYRVARNRAKFDWQEGIASFDRNHLIKNRIARVADSDIETLQVQATTVTALLVKHSVRHIDLLQVDTEGHDYVIVKSVLDSGCFPSIIRYEHVNLTPEMNYVCRVLLDSHRYRFLELGPDTIAVRRK